MIKKQHYMTEQERYKLEALLRAGIPVAQIAQQLGFCRQTIYNEIKRGEYIHDCGWYEEKRYSADKAQQIHNYNQTAKGRPLKIGTDRKYADFLESKMLGRKDDGKFDRRTRLSPAAALTEARRAGFSIGICVSTLYSYIEKGVFLHLTDKDLWEKGRAKKQSYNTVKRIAHPLLPSITDRPQEIDLRSEPGHWEMDLVVGCANSSPVLLTLTERFSRRELIFKLPNRKAATIRGVFDTLERKMGRSFRNIFRSITTDNGPEFLEYDKLIQSVYGGTRFKVYYCHSYAAWEKGTNENHNRMIRRWFPKGTDFSKVTKKDIAALQNWMNHYPRRILNWKTPMETAA